MDKVKVVTVGLGYIGLPTSALIAQSGIKVHGVDVNQKVVDTINKGKIHIVEPSLDVAVEKAVKRARKGDGPTFLEAKTYRYKGHSMSDAQHYRTKDEVNEYQKIDPINTTLEFIKENKYASDKEIEAINQEVKETIADAIKFAEESPFPVKQDLYDSVYEQEDYPFIKD